jgi:O-acetyl-ADP-ribose deacetylase (regulator of RNase III)
MLGAALERLRSGTPLERVVFCFYGREAYRVFETTLRTLLTETEQQ